MNPRARAAGIAGLLAGLGLIGEFVLFTLSGSGPTILQHASTALPFLQEHVTTIRAAAVLGAANAALAVIFLAGLAARLHAKAPTLAVAAPRMLIAWRSNPHIPGAGVGFPARRPPRISCRSSTDKRRRRSTAGRRFSRNPHSSRHQMAVATRIVHQIVHQ